MKFRVGPEVYTLVISDRPIYNEEGAELDGCAIESRRLLVISPHIEVGERESIAVHELSEAYSFHFPLPRTSEEHHQLKAVVTKSFREDLEQAGGIKVLLAMTPHRVGGMGRPKEVPPPKRTNREETTLRLSDRRACGNCGEYVLPGDIGQGLPQFDKDVRRWEVLRWIKDCWSCGRCQTWWEYCNESGRASGEFVSGAPIMRGAEAAAFLRDREPVPDPNVHVEKYHVVPIDCD